MTFPTQGALGKKVNRWTPGEPFCEGFKDCEVAFAFRAPAKRVVKLRSKLNELYQSAHESEVYNSKEDVHFVRHTNSYWAFHNCNHELAL